MTDNKVDPQTWKFVTIIVAIIGCIGVLGAAFIGILPQILRPTPSVVVTEIVNLPSETLPSNTESSNTISYFSDNFNSGVDFRQDLWAKFESDGCTVQQQNGQVVFNSTGGNTATSVCLISAGIMPFEKAGSMEASFRIASGGTNISSVGIEFSNGTFAEGSQNWIIQCGILQTDSQNQVELYFNVNSTYPQGEPEIFKSMPALAERWYRMKLEIIPEEDKVICFADGEIVGTYEGDKLTELHQLNLDRKLLGYWSTSSLLEFYADDVNLLPPK